MSKKKRVGIVGCGAMGLYSLKHLADSPDPLDIHVFDSATLPGSGMPYRDGMNADYMLCNAFSREIPPLTRTLAQWLKTQPATELDEWALRPDDIDTRAFYPRVLIGEFLSAEFNAMCKIAEESGHRVHVHRNNRVVDILVDDACALVVLDSDDGGRHIPLDTVLIATGHDWPSHPSIDKVQLLSPWPYTQVTNQPSGQIGILGSSLSAVDIVIALGHAHGKFTEHEGQLIWTPNDAVTELHVTMVSRSGIMPEGDFYYPFPYEPLTCITAEAVAAELEQGTNGLLFRVFQLLLNELDAVDSGYLRHLGKDARAIEGFASAYFRDRVERGGLKAVRDDLKEVRATMRRKETIAYRYALLRGHENFEIALPHLDAQDWDQFKEYLLPVFADCYAAVPHLSIARILAMAQSGALSLVASGDDATFRYSNSGQIEVGFEEETLLVDCMFDARGQASKGLSALPFPSLRKMLEDDSSPILEPFELSLSIDTGAQVYCLAMPQILERYPFSQGLPNCCELSRTVVDDVLSRQPGVTP